MRQFSRSKIGQVASSAATSLVVGGFIVLSSAMNASADVVATATTEDASAYGGYGLKFKTPAGNAEDDLVYNLYYNNAIAAAQGTAYLLSSVYTGTPNSLSTSTAGYIDSAVASGNEFTFTPSTTLQPSTSYYLYTNTFFYADLEVYGEAPATDSFQYARTLTGNFPAPTANQAPDFLLTGAAVPEPASLAVIGIPAAMALLRRRRKTV